MSFQEIKPVQSANFYIDLAFRTANKKAAEKKIIAHTKLDKVKKNEINKIDIVKTVLNKHFMKILRSFPNMDDLTPFYTQMIKCMLDYAAIKKSLGAVNWANKKVNEFHRSYSYKIKDSKEFKTLTKQKKEFYGRISSLVKQIKDELRYLEHVRRELKEFPVIKKLFTIAIIGFPNIGKTTLLYKLTSSRPDIKAYPFTTKNINVGYIKTKEQKIQILDTPGTLNRFNKMNKYEKEAHLAVKYCADVLVYVFDFTEPYPIKTQEELFKKVKEYNKPVVVYLSKMDIIKDKISKKGIKDPEELKKKLLVLAGRDNI